MCTWLWRKLHKLAKTLNLIKNDCFIIKLSINYYYKLIMLSLSITTSPFNLQTRLHECFVSLQNEINLFWCRFQKNSYIYITATPKLLHWLIVSSVYSSPKMYLLQLKKFNLSKSTMFICKILRFWKLIMMAIVLFSPL